MNFKRHNQYIVSHIHCVSKKCGIKLLALTSSTVNRFWYSFTLGNSNELSAK